MTLSTLVRGVRRVVEPPKPTWEIQLRRTLPTGEVKVQRRLAYDDLARATDEFDRLRALGGRAYTARHGYRLVLLDRGSSCPAS